jgi:hypothetical protein
MRARCRRSRAGRGRRLRDVAPHPVGLARSARRRRSACRRRWDLVAVDQLVVGEAGCFRPYLGQRYDAAELVDGALVQAVQDHARLVAFEVPPDGLALAGDLAPERDRGEVAPPPLGYRDVGLDGGDPREGDGPGPRRGGGRRRRSPRRSPLPPGSVAWVPSSRSPALSRSWTPGDGVDAGGGRLGRRRAGRRSAASARATVLGGRRLGEQQRPRTPEAMSEAIGTCSRWCPPARRR